MLRYFLLIFLSLTNAAPTNHGRLLPRDASSFPQSASVSTLKNINTSSPLPHLRHRQASLLEIKNDRRPAIEVTFGTESFYRGVDTGSANTWVASSSGTCEPAGTCYFGSTFEIDDSFTPIQGQHLNSSYEVGQWVNGYIGTRL